MCSLFWSVLFDHLTHLPSLQNEIYNQLGSSWCIDTNIITSEGQMFREVALYLYCICIDHHFTNSLSILLRFSYSTKICAINIYKAIVNKKKPKVLRFQVYIIKSNVIGFEILSFQNVSKSATQSYIAQILVGSKVLFLRPESWFIIVSYGGGGGSQ